MRLGACRAGKGKRGHLCRKAFGASGMTHWRLQRKGSSDRPKVRAYAGRTPQRPQRDSLRASMRLVVSRGQKRAHMQDGLRIPRGGVGRVLCGMSSEASQMSERSRKRANRRGPSEARRGLRDSNYQPSKPREPIPEEALQFMGLPLTAEE